VQELTPAVLAALCSAIVVIGAYHVLIAGPRWKRIDATLSVHDGLLGGGAAPATQRMDRLEAMATSVEADQKAQAARVAELERAVRVEVTRLGFVRYNAFSDVGSDLSYALALLNKDGDGVVLSSIYSREDTRTYGKSVAAFQAAQDASNEEKAAIAKARAATT
jgi:hypothetical protein